MKTTAKVKKVRVDGVEYNHYRFKISYQNYKREDKEFVRWASTAENAIKTLMHQYGWILAQDIPPVYEDDYCKALVKVWVPNSKQTVITGDEGSNFFYWVEAYQSDL